MAGGGPAAPGCLSRRDLRTATLISTSNRGAAVSIGNSAKYVLKAVSNLHKQGDRPNVFLFATARGGSTWVMEILASQPGMKYYDEPFNIRRDNVARIGLFTKWEDLMADTDDPDRVITFLNDLVAGEYP